MSDWERVSSDSKHQRSLQKKNEPENISRMYPRQQYAGDVSPVNQPPQQNKEYLHRFAGLSIGLTSVLSEHVLSHPCVVLRRQCQVHNSSRWYHLTPFTILHTVFNIQFHQGITVLWKGIGSVLMLKGIEVANETAISELTSLPKEVNRHSSAKKLLSHLLLKSVNIAIMTPFYAASLVETVQSDVASDRPGVFDFIIEGFGRVASLATGQPSRLLPVWKLIVPSVVYGLLHYSISSLAKYRIVVTMQREFLHNKSDDDGDDDRSLYQIYYPELVAAFTGNLLADTLLYPLETMLHRLFLQGTRTIIDNTDTGLEVLPIMTRYDNLLDCYRTILAEEGVAALYKGFGALILQYALHIVILKLSRVMFSLMSKEVKRKEVVARTKSKPQSSAADYH